MHISLELAEQIFQEPINAASLGIHKGNIITVD